MIMIKGSDVSVVGGMIVWGCGAEGNGNLVSDFRDVGEFTGIRVEGSVNVTYSQGESAQLELTADSNLLELITTDVINDVLVVGTSGSFSTESNMTLHCHSSNIKRVCIVGSGDVDLQTVSVGALKLECKGTGGIFVQGEAHKLTVSIRDTGSVEASGLDAEVAKISVRSTGSATAKVTESLEAVIRGSGNIQVTGSPNVAKQAVTGSGKLTVE
jgi:hypothetical protein